MLNAYFDGAKSEAGFLTLACLATTDEVWKKLESDWSEMRSALNKSEANVNHEILHMTDLVSGGGEYKGWCFEQKSYVIHNYLNVLCRLGHTPGVFCGSSTVDLSAHKYWSEFKSIPRPHRLCMRSLMKRLLEWSLVWPMDRQHIQHPLALHFDRGENFKQHIMEDWSRPSKEFKDPWCGVVHSIGETCSEVSPAIQMVDMVAWSVQKLAAQRRAQEVKPSTIKYEPFVTSIMATVGGFHGLLDGKDFEFRHFKEEGFAARDRQRARQAYQKIQKQNNKLLIKFS